MIVNSNLGYVTKKVQEICPQVLTFEFFLNHPDAITLEHVIKTLHFNKRRCDVIVCDQGVIIGNMFPENIVSINYLVKDTGLWILGEPLSRQPEQTVNLLAKLLK